MFGIVLTCAEPTQVDHVGEDSNGACTLANFGAASVKFHNGFSLTLLN